MKSITVSPTMPYWSQKAPDYTFTTHLSGGVAPEMIIPLHSIIVPLETSTLSRSNFTQISRTVLYFPSTSAVYTVRVPWNSPFAHFSNDFGQCECSSAPHSLHQCFRKKQNTFIPKTFHGFYIEYDVDQTACARWIMCLNQNITFVNVWQHNWKQSLTSINCITIWLHLQSRIMECDQITTAALARYI